MSKKNTISREIIIFLGILTGILIASWINLYLGLTLVALTLVLVISMKMRRTKYSDIRTDIMQEDARLLMEANFGINLVPPR